MLPNRQIDPSVLPGRFVLDSINSILGGIDQVNFLGAFVNTSAMGIANPGVLATYVEQSDVRGKKYSSQASFV